MYQAYVRGDLETFVGYMHPKIAEMMGGKEKALETIRKAQAASAAQGLTATKATVAPVQQLVEVAPAKLQVIIPADVMMSGKDAEVRQRSFLLGFSSDGGKAWKFVDTGSGGGDTLRKIFPECSPASEDPPARQAGGHPARRERALTGGSAAVARTREWCSGPRNMRDVRSSFAAYGELCTAAEEH